MSNTQRSMNKWGNTKHTTYPAIQRAPPEADRNITKQGLMYYHNFIIFFNLTEALPTNQRSIRQVYKYAR